MTILQRLTADPIRTAPLAIAAIGATAIGGALIFEHVFGLQPCPLCLEQRIAYYVSIPLAVLLLIGISAGAARKVLLAGFVVIAAGMLWNAGLGVYHSGVEWGWWPGPQDCSGPVNSLGSAGNLLKKIESIRIVRCDEVQWRFLGLSLAGYNVLISLALVALALWAAFGLWRERARG